MMLLMGILLSACGEFDEGSNEFVLPTAISLENENIGGTEPTVIAPTGTTESRLVIGDITVSGNEPGGELTLEQSGIPAGEIIDTVFFNGFLYLSATLFQEGGIVDLYINYTGTEELDIEVIDIFCSEGDRSYSGLINSYPSNIAFYTDTHTMRDTNSAIAYDAREEVAPLYSIPSDTTVKVASFDRPLSAANCWMNLKFSEFGDKFSSETFDLADWNEIPFRFN